MICRKRNSAVDELALDNVIAAQLDVSDEASIAALRDRIESEFGRLDILVNNAAIHYDNWQKAVTADLNVVQEALVTNLYGPWRLTQALLPLLKKSGRARIVNVSSGAGALTTMAAGPPAYSTSKVALNALTRMLAAELKARRHPGQFNLPRLGGHGDGRRRRTADPRWRGRHRLGGAAAR